MKFSRLYTNNPDLFVPIEFNEGINVIVGRVTKPKESNKDSHNLGKSLLAQVLDFCLLKKISKNSFLKKQAGSGFKGLVFFLEIKLNGGGFITVRRPVEGNTKILFWTHEEPKKDLSSFAPDTWPERPSSLPLAKAYLNEQLGFDTLGHYDYRKGISYFLRSQDDYRNVFQLSKFAGGKHIDWKPFMAMLLGFSEELVRQKYEVDDQIDAEEAFASRYSMESGTRVDSFDKIRGLLTIKKQELNELVRDSHEFDLHRTDTSLNEELVNVIERRNAELNDRLYTIDFELTQIEAAFDRKLRFDLDKIRIIFEQASLTLPDLMLRSYDELLAFNRGITEDRNSRLERRRSELATEKVTLAKELNSINQQRREMLSVLREENWFKRFKQLQAEIAKANADASRLEAQLENVNRLEEFRQRIDEYEATKMRLTAEIRDEVKVGNPTFENIRKRFNQIYRAVFDVPALLSVHPNGEGNLEFEANPVQDDSIPVATSEGDGHTYKKVLCAAFDLALLEVYQNRSFYRFVYHDGIFESLDDRKKLNLLKVVRELCSDSGLQYIMSVIDADIPRNSAGRRVEFQADEVILELSDSGDAGRLFKMPKF